jgi:acetylornithine deacetylase/succinyl-diaminopimelate desuccinylase-like protein
VHHRFALLMTVLGRFEAELRRVGEQRDVASSVDVLARVPVAPLDPGLREVLRRCAAAVGVDAPMLVSGAGHDAQNPQLSGVPTGMIFVRSTGGSHTPLESCDLADAALAADTLARAINELAA